MVDSVKNAKRSYSPNIYPEQYENEVKSYHNFGQKESSETSSLEKRKINNGNLPISNFTKHAPGVFEERKNETSKSKKKEIQIIKEKIQKLKR